jgi:hypothetical protein
MENSESFEIVEDLRQSREYGEYMESIGWKTVPVGKNQIFIRKLGPVSIAKLQRTRGSLPIKDIENVIKANRVMMVKIEPLVGEGPLGYRVSNWPLLGTKTLRVDLRPSQEKIFNSFKKDCRYILKKSLISNYLISNNNFDYFYKIWQKSAKRKGLWIPKNKEYKSLVSVFGGKTFCITINDMAGALVLTHKKTAFYYYAGSTKEGTALNLPYQIVWEAMKEAKKRGCRVWDFEGVYDSRWPNKGWLGFSHFKKSFGGKEIEFPGSFEKWRWPI